jgi:hypothetical protein
MDEALEAIRTLALGIRDIAVRETAEGRMAGPTHQKIFDATGKILDIMSPHLKT